ncbi:hypothetical protein HK105_206188 [Polyrhizophydium stewartii]|uniref:Ankyrin repeat protein n=1 Tax=Polyrhizophydium stewartii TaxID=2732419 RepID=A0ABR4N417_9FUNG
MLERLPAELDAMIMRHAGCMTQFLHGRLPQPMSLQTLMLLWTECLIDDDARGVQLLPRIDFKLYEFFVHSNKMVQTLNQYGYYVSTIQSSRSSADYVNHELVDHVVKCPQAAPLLLPFFRRLCHRWQSSSFQFRLMCIAAAAAGDLAVLSKLMEGGPTTEDWWIENIFRSSSSRIAGRLGHREIMCKMFDVSKLEHFSLDGAVQSNNLELVKMFVSRGARIDDNDIVAALRFNFNELALYLIQQELLRESSRLKYMVTLCLFAGNIEMLRAICNPAEFRRSDFGERLPAAARDGPLEIIKSVFEMPGEATFLEETLTQAIVGGWVDVAHWLVTGPAKDVWSPQLVECVAKSSLVMFGVLQQARSDLPTSDIMDAAACIGNLALVKGMHERGFGCTTAAMDGAAENSHGNVVRFLHDNRTEGCTRTGLARALNIMDHEIVDLMLASPVSGSVKDAQKVLYKWSLTEQVVRILHHGVDCSKCQCTMLSQAITACNFDHIGVFVELRHVVSDDAACNLAERNDVDMFMRLAPLLGSRHWDIMEDEASKTSAVDVLALIRKRKADDAAAAESQPTQKRAKQG